MEINPQEAKLEIKDNGLENFHNFWEKILLHFSGDYQKGTGLGLFIAKRPMEKINGTIKMESVVGEGTSFSITIPNSNQTFINTMDK